MNDWADRDADIADFVMVYGQAVFRETGNELDLWLESGCFQVEARPCVLNARADAGARLNRFEATAKRSFEN